MPVAQVWQAPPTQICPAAQQVVAHTVWPAWHPQVPLTQLCPAGQQALPHTCWLAPHVVVQTPGLVHVCVDGQQTPPQGMVPWAHVWQVLLAQIWPAAQQVVPQTV